MAEFKATPSRDEIIAETRRIKESLAASFDYDIKRMLDDARKRQKTSGRTIIPAPSRQTA